MIVMKFGGTSVGTPERMKSVCQLITRNEEPRLVVLSAMSGDAKPVGVVEDTAVAPERMAAYMRDFRAMMAESGLRLHMRIFLEKNYCLKID